MLCWVGLAFVLDERRGKMDAYCRRPPESSYCWLMTSSMLMKLLSRERRVRLSQDKQISMIIIITWEMREKSSKTGLIVSRQVSVSGNLLLIDWKQCSCLTRRERESKWQLRSIVITHNISIISKRRKFFTSFTSLVNAKICVAESERDREEVWHYIWEREWVSEFISKLTSWSPVQIMKERGGQSISMSFCTVVKYFAVTAEHKHWLL